MCCTDTPLLQESVRSTSWRVLYRHPSLTGVRQEYVMTCAVPSPLSCRSTSGVRHEYVMACAVPSPLSCRSPSGVRHACCTVTPLLQESVTAGPSARSARSATCTACCGAVGVRHVCDTSYLCCRSPSHRDPVRGVRGPRRVRHAVALPGGGLCRLHAVSAVLRHGPPRHQARLPARRHPGGQRVGQWRVGRWFVCFIA